MKVLCLSDKVVSFIHSPQVKERFAEAELVIACGDLPYEYIEYAANELGVDCLHVRGNHSHVIENTSAGPVKGPRGAVSLHRKIVTYKGLTFAGIDGSLRYRIGPFQYTQGEMWSHALFLANRLLRYHLRYGRSLDVLVTHAPPFGIHDDTDLPHQGVKAFRWLVKTFKPEYHLHGHIHIYRPDTPTETTLGHTRVVNTYGWKVIEVEPKYSSTNLP
jgi:Icc-related predicted phosphoesterase